MAYKLFPKRLTTLDFLRGFFLFVIIVDHVELYPSGFDFLTGRGRLWVSAAEGFFFISGLLVAYIYRKKLQKGASFASITRKIWQRAALLYACSVGLTLLFTYWAVTAGAGQIKYGLPAVINWPDIVSQTLQLRYSFGWADFLPHYVVFLLAAPFILYLLTKGKWWLVAVASALVWTQRGQEGFDLAWQTLFFGGMIIGYHWDRLQSWAAEWSAQQKRVASRLVYAATAVTLLVSYLGVYLLPELEAHRATLPMWLADFTLQWHNHNEAIWPFFEKWTMEPGRILTFAVWFSAAYLWSQTHLHLIHRYTRGAFELLGRNSLFVYGLHALVIFVLHLAVRGSTAVWQNVLLTSSVLVFIWLVTYAKSSLLVQSRTNRQEATSSTFSRLILATPTEEEQK